MLLGGGSMCEAGGCGLQGEEGDASGCLCLPTRVPAIVFAKPAEANTAPKK